MVVPTNNRLKYGYVTPKIEDIDGLQAALDGKQDTGAPVSTGVTDHAALTGLGDDDHTQYLTNGRGDARYSPLGHIHDYEEAGLMASHDAASNPHPQYMTQAESDAAYSGLDHTHPISDVVGLQTALDGKQVAGSYADASHSHTIANVTGLQAALDDKAAASHNHDVAYASIAALGDKQDTLVSGSNIKTINGASVLGSGDIVIAGGGGSTLSGSIVANLTTARFEHEQSLAVDGVTAANRIFLSIAPHLDADENHETMLDMVTLSGSPDTDLINISMTFSQLTRGDIRLNWSAF